MNRLLLPNEVLSNIYQFDGTYRDIHDNIIHKLNMNFTLKVIANAYSRIYERKRFIHFYNQCIKNTQTIQNIQQLLDDFQYDYNTNSYFRTFFKAYTIYPDWTYYSSFIDILNEIIEKDKKMIKELFYR